MCVENERVVANIVSATRYAELTAREQQKSLAPQRKREFNETYKAGLPNKMPIMRHMACGATAGCLGKSRCGAEWRSSTFT